VLVSAFSDLHHHRERLHRTAREERIDLEKASEQVLQNAVGSIDGDLEIEAISRGGDPAEVPADVADEQARS
jgi:hypothetical protein